MKARERLLLDCAAAGLAFGLRWWRPIRRELELLGNLVNTERGMVTEIKMSDIFCWLPHSVTIVEGTITDTTVLFLTWEISKKYLCIYNRIRIF